MTDRTAAPEAICENCGHGAYSHENREYDGDAAPCQVCWCMDFELDDDETHEPRRLSKANEILEGLLGPEPDWGPTWHCFNCGRSCNSQLTDGRHICTDCIEIDRKAQDLFDRVMSAFYPNQSHSKENL